MVQEDVVKNRERALKEESTCSDLEGTENIDSAPGTIVKRKGKTNFEKKRENKLSNCRVSCLANECFKKDK